jgi:hypothetical protein
VSAPALAVAQARDAQQARASLSRFASRADIAAADDRIRKTDEEATRRTEAEAPLLAEITS